MGFYKSRILPYLVHSSMRQETLTPYRRRLMTSVSGRVLEIGVGSGINLPLYPTTTKGVIGIDPSPRLLSMAREAAKEASFPVEFVEASAEAIPLERGSVDTVVTTWTLCSIPDVARALTEVRRVLAPSGCLLFVEHGLSPDSRVGGWQNRLTPLWKRIGGGCHLNRPIGQLVADAGFHVEQVSTGYMKGPKPMTFMYEGRARPAAQEA